MRLFGIHINCEMITTTHLTNPSSHIITVVLHGWLECLRSPLSKFQMYNAVVINYSYHTIHYIPRIHSFICEVLI